MHQRTTLLLGPRGVEHGDDMEWTSRTELTSSRVTHRRASWQGAGPLLEKVMMCQTV